MTLDSAYNVQRFVVGQVDEIPPGARKLVVPFRGRAGIGVFNVNGQYFALRNICPHKQGPLCTGFVYGRIVADAPPSGRSLDVSDYAVERDGEIIRCPWHLWEFEIATGRCLVDSRARVKTYPVRVEENRVVVYADPADLPPRVDAAAQSASALGVASAGQDPGSHRDRRTAAIDPSCPC